MPRKKSDKASQTVDGLETSVKPLESTENTSSNSDSTPINGETSAEALNWSYPGANVLERPLSFNRQRVEVFC